MKRSIGLFVLLAPAVFAQTNLFQTRFARSWNSLSNEFPRTVAVSISDSVKRDDHIVFETTRSYMGVTRPRGATEIWISDDKVYISAPRQSTILRYDLNKQWLVLPKQKVYYEHVLDKPLVEEEQERNPIHRMGFDYEPQYDWIIKDTGEEQTIEGWRCHHYIAEGDADYAEQAIDLWITQEAPADLHRYYEKYVKHELADDAELAGLYKAFPALTRALIVFSKKTISLAALPEFVDEIKAKKVESSNPPPKIYELPEGCQKANSYAEFIQASRRR